MTHERLRLRPAGRRPARRPARAGRSPRRRGGPRGAGASWLALFPAAAFASFLTLVPRVESAGAVGVSVGWIPALDVALRFRIDGLGLIFALLISGIGALVIVYAAAYLDRDAGRARFFAFLLLFMGSMLGLVLADDLIALFVFWELTSITSFALIGFEHERPQARHAAQQALLVTGVGGLALLAGLLLLSIASGEATLSGLAASGALDVGDPLVVAAFLLVAAGAFTKSAQLPFHFWLPGAMAAPTPVSAYLHSATMVKAGVYLLARLHPALGELWLWTPLLATVGAATMLGGAVLALRESDLKRVLAYSTISALGTLVLLIGVGEAAALKAAIVFLVAHALYKAALFMVAGAIDHEAGTRDLDALGGLRQAMPWTAAAALLAALSKAGLPPALGFLSKETIFVAGVENPAAAALSALFLVAAALVFALAALVGLRPFVGARIAMPRVPHEVSPALWAPPLLLAAFGILGGLAAPWLAAPLLEPAVEAASGEPQSLKLSLWPGFGAVLSLSAAAIGGGLAAVLALDRLRELARSPRLPAASRAYDGAMAGLNAIARAQTRLIQSGQLARYISVVVVTVVALVAVQLAARDAAAWPGAWGDVRPIEAAVAAAILVAAFAAAVSHSRLQAVLALGAAGFGVASLFALFGAPDLAMTQVLVETLTVILFVEVFRHLPVTAPRRPTWTRARDAALAGAFGLTMTALTWSVLAHRGERHISQFFLETSRPLAQGRNVVNTILVDFRALDTLGEIVVLAIAAIGVIALLRLRPHGGQEADS